MVGVTAYSTILIDIEHLGQGTILPGAFNTSSAMQDVANINAGIVIINFITPFVVPPVVQVQPVRVDVDWTSAGDPFMPSGLDTHREVFPLPPTLAVSGEVDQIIDIPVAQVYVDGALPVEGRPMPLSTRIEIENKLTAFRLLAVERTHISIQFSSFLGQVVRVRPYNMETGDAGADDVQQGTIRGILFNYQAAGDLNTGT